MNKLLQWQLLPLKHAEGLGLHRQIWDRLNERLMSQHALLDSLFIDHLLRHFGDRGALLAIGRQGQEIVAMLLLYGSPRGPGVWASYLPAQMQIGPSLVPPGLDIGGLFAALPGYAAEVDLLCNDPRFGDLRSRPGRPIRTVRHALTMHVDLRGGFDDYWTQRPRKLIQNMRRYLRRLQDEGAPVRLDVVSDGQAMPAAVARYAGLESSGWKGRQGTAVGVDNAQGRFYGDVMQQFAERGQAVVYELWLGEHLLAARMVLLRNGMAVMLKTAYDEASERFAPGRVLLMRTLEDLFHRLPGGVVEFYTDADADLLAWSSGRRWINHVSVYRHRGLPTVYDLLRRAARLRRRSNGARQAQVSDGSTTIERYGHVRELPADALALMARAEQRHIEFGADWFANLIDSVHAQEPQAQAARLWVLRSQGRVLAVLPTVLHRGPSGNEVSALSNFYTALYAPALDDDAEAQDLLPLARALREPGHAAAVYRFSPMDPESREFSVLKGALRGAGLSAHAYLAFGNWYEPVRQTWADYLKDRSGQVRSTIKRNAKKFAAEGGRLEIVHGGDGLEAGLTAYQAVYAKSWKVAEPYPTFVPNLIRLCARRGWLRLGLAWLGDKPIAAQIWIVANGRADIYKLAYDEEHKALAPGTLLTALMMEQAIDVDRVREIDYLIGDDAYKAAWMSQRRERFGLVAYDLAKWRGLLGLARQLVGQAWRRLRPHPAPPKDNPAA